MAIQLRKALRSIQYFFPFLQDSRFYIQRYYNKIRKSTMHEDFFALSLFKWPDPSLFIDVGANRGFSIQAMKMIVPHAMIKAFEPNPIIFNRLKKIYEESSDIDLHEIGLGESSLDTTLWVPVYRQWLLDGLGSFDRDEAYNWLNSDRVYFFDERHLQLRQYPCAIRRLDEFELAPAFIKIDVQGFEPQVLRGAEATLHRSHPLLMIENPDSFADVDFLQQAGYTICTYENGRLLPGRAGKVNSFFLTDQHLRQLS